MYCPHCAAENRIEDARFCRACGADLRFVAQAMDEHPALMIRLARRVDAWVRKRDEQRASEPTLELLFGLVLVLGGIFGALWSSESFAVWFFALLFGGFMIVTGGLHLWRDKLIQRGDYVPNPERIPGDLSIYKPSLPRSSAPLELPIPLQQSVVGRTTAELRRPEPQLAPPPSVTEHTTKHLDAEPERRSPRL